MKSRRTSAKAAGVLALAVLAFVTLCPDVSHGYSLWSDRQPNTGILVYAHWGQIADASPIPYVIDSRGTSQPGANRREFDIIQEAHERWARVPSSSVNWKATISTVPVFFDPFDGVNVVVFNTPFNDPFLGPGVIGYSFPVFDNLTGEFIDSDLVLNDAFPFSFEPETVQDTDIELGLISLLGVTHHEAGHRLGLGHTYIRDAVMWPFAQPRMSNPRPDDIAGESFLYPTNNYNNLFGSVSGTVLEDERLIPITGAHIVLENAETGRATVSAFSYPDGSYRMDGVPPGAYVLRNETSDPRRIWDIFLPGFFQQIYQSEYFGHTQRRDEARVVIVSRGVESRNIDFRLTTAYRKDSFEDDNTFQQARPIQTNGFGERHTFYPPGDIDFFSFQARAGRTYRIQVKDIEWSAASVFFSDTGEGLHSLRLYDTDASTVLAQNDAYDPFLKNAQTNLFNNIRSQIEFTATKDGTYYATVQNMEIFLELALNFGWSTTKYAWGPGTSYTFKVTELNAPIPTATPIITPSPQPTPSPVSHSLPEVALVSPNEGPLAVIGIDLHDDDNRPQLSMVKVRIQNAGTLGIVSPDVFLPLAVDETSGLSIWADGGNGNFSRGSFDLQSDTVLRNEPGYPRLQIDSANDSLIVTFKFSPIDGNAALDSGRPDGIFDFFVVARYSSQVKHGLAFKYDIPPMGIEIVTAASRKEVFSTAYPAVPKVITGDVVRLINFVNPPVVNDDDQVEDREEHPIPGNSDPIAVMGISAAGPNSEDYHIYQVDVTLVPIKTFQRSDLLPLSDGAFSGISLWRDAPGSEDGLFEPDRDQLIPVSLPIYERKGDVFKVSLIPENPQAIPTDDIAQGNQGADFFVCIRTSDRILFGDMFRVELRYDIEAGRGPVLLNNGLSTSREMTKTSNPPTFELKAKPRPSFLFTNMIQPGQRIPWQSKSVALLGISVNDHGADVFEVGDDENEGYIFRDFKFQILDANGDGSFTLDDLRPILGIPSIDLQFYETDLGLALYRDDRTEIGNQFDDDGDGFTDEELRDNQDNDRDGLTDEDCGDFDEKGFVDGQFDARDDLMAQFPGNHWPAGNLSVGHYTPPLVQALPGGTSWQVNFDMRFFRLGELHNCLGLNAIGAHPYDGGNFKGPGSVLDKFAHTFSNFGSGSLDLVHTNNYPLFFGGHETQAISTKGEFLAGTPCDLQFEPVIIGEGTSAIVIGSVVTAAGEIFTVDYDYFYEMPNDDVGPTAGPDYFVVARTSDLAAHGDSFKLRVDTGAFSYTRYSSLANNNIDLAPGTSDGFIETNAITVERPIDIRLHKLTTPGQKIAAGSDNPRADKPLPVLGLDMDVGGSFTRPLPGNSEEVIFELKVEIVSERNFTPSDLLPVTQDDSSGIIIFQDTGPQQGVFEYGLDPVVRLARGLTPSDITGSGTSSDPYVYTLTPAFPMAIPYDNNGDSAGTDYFIAIRASRSLNYLDAFRVRIRREGFEGSAPVTTTPSMRETDIITGDVPLLISSITDQTVPGQVIRAANRSPKVPIFGLNVYDGGGNVKMTQITVEFQGIAGAPTPTPTPVSATATVVPTTSPVPIPTGTPAAGSFTRSDIASPVTTEAGGLALYRDDGNGTWGPEDAFVPMTNASWNNLRLTMSFNGVDVPDDDPGLRNDFFLVIRTSSTISDGDQFRCRVPPQGIAFGPAGNSQNEAFTNFLTARISPRIQLTRPAQDQARTSLESVDVEWIVEGQNALVRIYYINLADALARGYDVAALRSTPLDANDPLLTAISPILPGGRNQFPWDLRNVGNGSYIVYAIVDVSQSEFGLRDVDGFIDYDFAYSPGIVTVNNPAPQIVLHEPNQLKEVPDPVSGIFQIVFDATFTSVASVRLVAEASGSNPPLEFTIVDGLALSNSPVVNRAYNWDLSRIANGEYLVKGIIKDGDNSIVDYAPGTVVVDRSATLQAGWPLAVLGDPLASPVVADLDGVIENNRPTYEVAIGVERNLYAILSDGTFMPGFPIQIPSLFISSPAIGDVNDDGHNDIAIVAIDGTVYIVNRDGTTQANRDNNPATPDWTVDLAGEAASGPLLANLSPSRRGLEMVVVAGKVNSGTEIIGRVNILSSTGSIITTARIAVSGRLASSPALGDFDGDGIFNDIAVGSSDGLYLFHYANETLTPLPRIPAAMGLPITSSPAFADLDGIPGDEVIFGTDAGVVHAFRSDGSAYPGFPIALSSSIESSPSVGRFEPDDSGPSIVLGTLNSRVFILSPDAGGSYVIARQALLAGRVRSSPAISDVGGGALSPGQEIIITTENGLLYVLNRNLENLKGGSPDPVFRVDGEIRTSPAVLSLDTDGDAEVVVTGMNPDFVHAIDLPEVVSAVPEWPMWRHDAFHTGRWTATNNVKGDIYVLDGSGNILDLNGNLLAGGPYFGWDIARAMETAPGGEGLYVLDGFGAIHTVGSAPALSGVPYFGWDIAADLECVPAIQGLIVLDGFGGTYGVNMELPGVTPYFGWDIAKSVEATPSGNGYYVLDGFGGIHGTGDAKAFAQDTVYFGWDIARDIALTDDGQGMVLLDGYGNLHALGAAESYDGGVFFGSDVAVGLKLMQSEDAAIILATGGEYLYSKKSDGTKSPRVSGKSFDSAKQNGALKSPRGLEVVDR